MKRVITLATAQAQYPNRYTLEHIPTWAKRRPCDSGGTSTLYYAPQYRTDTEWYENTVFPGEGGKPKRDDDCFSSNQSWPCGQWLERPIHHTVRTECGHGRAVYRPDWDKDQPWATYTDGTADRHVATLESVRQYFAAKGMYVSEAAL